MSVQLEPSNPNDYCGDAAALAGYLYGECDAAERAAIEAHMAVCVSCATELASLGATRTALAAWTPPEAELGFQITSARDATNVVRPARWWQRPLPAWAQAAAAMLIFAAGAAMGMRAGQPVAPAAVSARPAAVAATAVSTDDLAALERRLREEMTTLRTATPATANARPLQTSGSDEQLVRRFRAMLEESERRQERELALRLTQVLRDVDSQRRVDLARIERTLGQMEDVTGAEAMQQRQMLNYFIRTASQRPQ